MTRVELIQDTAKHLFLRYANPTIDAREAADRAIVDALVFVNAIDSAIKDGRLAPPQYPEGR